MTFEVHFQFKSEMQILKVLATSVFIQRLLAAATQRSVIVKFQCNSNLSQFITYASLSKLSRLSSIKLEAYAKIPMLRSHLFQGMTQSSMLVAIFRDQSLVDL